ncbi:Rha family transcriptional regulator [Priestia aryabhattai]
MNLVIIKDNKAVTDSLTVAEVFGKRHDAVLRDIRNQIQKLEQADMADFNLHNFVEVGYKDNQNRYYTKIDLTEDAFTLIAMSYTTPEAMKMKIKFLGEFKRMKSALEKTNPYANLSPELQAIFLIDERTQKMESRLNQLENNMTIDYGQQLSIQNAGKARALQFLGGKESAAYRDKSIRQKAFSAIWKDVKEYFNVDSYKNIRATELDKAIEFIRGWSMSGRLCREVELINSQLQFSE